LHHIILRQNGILSLTFRRISMAFRDPFASMQPQAQTTAAAGVDQGLRAYMLRIYNYMASALALTGIISLVVANNPALMQAFFVVGPNGQAGLSGLGWLVLFAPLGLVMWMSFGLRNMSVQTAQVIYWLYAALIGLSLAPIFLAYTGESIARAFFI